MEARIQQVLDAQWDALEARSPQVRRVRRELALLLEEFAAQKQEESVQLETALGDAQTRLHETQRAEQTRRELETQLAAEAASPLAAEVAALGAEVADLDAQLRALQARRADAERRRREAESMLASRTAKFRYALADLDAKLGAKPDANPDAKPGTNPDAKPGAKRDAKRDGVHALQAQLARLRQQKHAVDAESNAAHGGQQMWQQVCRELEELDRDIKGLRREHMGRISFMLKHKITVLERLAAQAHESGWTALVVAIGHELQVLNEALDALNQAEARAAGGAQSE